MEGALGPFAVSVRDVANRPARSAYDARMAGIDRRSARTRKALHTALMTLILRKGYEAITVRDIVDEANVGRTTFYAHVGGKEDLLRAGFRHLREDLRQAIATPRTESSAPVILGFSLAMFRHAGEYVGMWRALLGDSGAMVALQEIRAAIGEAIGEDYRLVPKLDAIPRALAVDYLTGTLVSVLDWWLGSRSGQDPDEADAVFRRLVFGQVGEG